MEVHQLMLATESTVVARLLAEHAELLSGEPRAHRAEVRVTVASAAALAAVVEFVYEGTARVPRGQLLEVAAMARQLRMERLSALSAYHLVRTTLLLLSQCADRKVPRTGAGSKI
jgi:hypothetical protein